MAEAFFDLSGRAKLRVTGADRSRYLNGQISNDLRKATAASAIHACVLSAKGKIEADVFIAAEGEAYVVDTDEGMGPALAARLERYIIADDVLVEEVTEKFALLHVLGPDAPALSVKEERRKASRFGETGTDIWFERSHHEVVRQELARTLSFCGRGLRGGDAR